MGLRRYDLNLLPVLDALLRWSNVTRAGKDVGMSQSAMSHALSRLRQLLGDELLVATGRGMMLTRRAEELIAPLQGAMEVLERLLDAGSFDPATSNRRFKVMTADYIAALVLPKLQRQIEKEAPNVSIQVTWGQAPLVDALLSHKLDVVLMPQGSLEGPDIRSEALFTDELVVIAAEDNRAVGSKLDLPTFECLPHVVFRKDGDEKLLSFADRQVARQPMKRREVVTVPDFLLLPLVVSQTSCLARN